MRHFQVLMLALLTAITFELGLVIIKLPTPTVQATAPSTNLPEDPHETLKRQVAVLQQQMTRVMQNEEKVLSRVSDDSRRLLMTCVQVNQTYHAVLAANPGLKLPAGFKLPFEGMIPLRVCTAEGWPGYSFDLPFGP